MIAELIALGWNVEVVDLGSGFPWPTAKMRANARRRLAALPRSSPLVVDGLAYGALPDVAEALRQSYPLIALVHHPLALETGLTANERELLRASELAALACAKHVVATSATTMRILTQDFHVPFDRLSVVEPGTDKVAVLRRARPQLVSMLAVGAVVPRKGYDVLVAALAKIAHLPWRLTIVGDCTRDAFTARHLRDEIMRLNLAHRIRMVGAVGAGELAHLYASSDFFVLPSRFEGYGMAFAEALAHGLPVVGTRAGAVEQTIPAGAGVLVLVDDADGLASALQQLVEKPEEREKLAAAARTAVFPSWREQGARFAMVLEKLM
jgi:glycosyltransferase involved in cell wall biosynthesis